MCRSRVQHPAIELSFYVAERLKCSAPAKTMQKVFGCYAMERTQPFFEAAVICIDVVDKQFWRAGFRTARLWRHMVGNATHPRECGNGLAAVEA